MDGHWLPAVHLFWWDTGDDSGISEEDWDRIKIHSGILCSRWLESVTAVTHLDLGRGRTFNQLCHQYILTGCRDFLLLVSVMFQSRYVSSFRSNLPDLFPSHKKERNLPIRWAQDACCLTSIFARPANNPPQLCSCSGLTLTLLWHTHVGVKSWIFVTDGAENKTSDTDLFLISAEIL